MPRAGDTPRLAAAERFFRPAAPKMNDQPLNIVLATDRLVVVDKPAGLLSVPGKGPDNRDCVASRIRRRFPEATGPVTVHRLDMDTSGLIMCALDADAQRELSAQFEARRVEKRYIALVAGTPPAESGTADAPMRADLANRPFQVVDRVLGRPAATRWRVLAYETDRTRVELVPLTGRTHQLRVHCAWAGAGGLRGAAWVAGTPTSRRRVEPGRPYWDHGGAVSHPILGDVLYGPPMIDPSDHPRLMLHAAALVFTDPGTGRRVEVASAAPF